MQRQINDKGLMLVRAFEGCQLKAYLDTSTPPVITIGWGRTMHGIHMGMTCTQEEADAWLLQDLRDEGSHFIDAWVKCPLNDDQYSALTSFIYNAGCGTFRRGMVFRCLALPTGPDYESAANAMLQYDTAGGTALAGLDRRRAAEHALFNSDYAAMEKAINA